MKENRLDRLTDGVLERVGRILGEVKLQYKNTNPYRMEPVEPKEKLYNYEKIAPEVKAYYQNADPVGFAQVEGEMEKLRRRYNA